MIVGNEEDMSLGEAEDEWQKEFDEGENYKINNKKERDNSILDFHDAELTEEKEKEKTNKSKVLKNAKKYLNRNRDFRCINNNAGKRKRLGLGSIQDKHIIVHHNKEKIE